VPDAVLHASTQMSVHTAAGADFLKRLGYSRVVPSREIEKKTMEKICRLNIETEVFVHGALCMSVSGQCYMSALIGSRSANRGCCGQACRLPFSASGIKNHCALSLKDLSLIPDVSELKKIGVDSLKIEGRMKRPEYSASAVNALNNALKGKDPDMHTLRGIFSRSGFTNGYFTGNRSDMFGVREKEDVISAQSLIPKIHELYRYERKVRNIDFHVVIKNGSPIKMTAVSGSFSETILGDLPEKANNRPTDLASLEKQLSRLGDTVYSIGKITAEIDEGLFIPIRKLNELRRLLIQNLNCRIISGLKPKYNITDYIPFASGKNIKRKNQNLSIRTFCQTDEQLRAALPLSEFCAAPYDVLLKNDYDCSEKERIIITPPRFIVDEDKLYSDLKKLRNNGFSHLLCHTLDSASIGSKLGFVLHGAPGLNIYNSFSAEYLKKIGFSDFIVSIEAKVSQIEKLNSDIPMGAVVYGRIPLMLTRNCPIQNENGCAKCTGYITDRTNRKFPVKCSNGYTEIYNSDILYMFDKPDLLNSVDFKVVMLSNENYDQTIDAVHGKKPSHIITRGLYYRGI